MQFAEIAVDFPDDRSRTFTYSVPEGMGVVAGDLVWVPFGPRTLQGVVFELTGAPLTEPDRIRPVIARTVDGPFVADHLLRVARWVAKHYRTSPFTSCSLLLPPGASTRLRTWLTVGPASGPTSGDNNVALSRRERQAIDYVRKSGRVPKSRAARSLGLGGAAIVDRLVRRRALLAEPAGFHSRGASTFAISAGTAPPTIGGCGRV